MFTYISFLWHGFQYFDSRKFEINEERTFSLFFVKKNIVYLNAKYLRNKINLEYNSDVNYCLWRKGERGDIQSPCIRPSDGTASSPLNSEHWFTEEVHHSALLYDICSSRERKKKKGEKKEIYSLSIGKPKFKKRKKKRKDGCGDIRDHSGNHHPLVRRGLLYHHWRHLQTPLILPTSLIPLLLHSATAKYS